MFIKFVLFVVLGFVFLSGAIIFAIWMQDTLENVIPEKLNASAAKERISKFANSPATLYSCAKIVEYMSLEIQKAYRTKTNAKVDVEYAFLVNDREVTLCLPSEFHDYKTPGWSYNFCENRYPKLKDAADRTALAMVIMQKATTELRHRFPTDLSGSHDVTFTYNKRFYDYQTVITIHYSATNLYYEDFKSW